jgi:glycosyltransferase involved in cell wall biosynthesis
MNVDTLSSTQIAAAEDDELHARLDGARLLICEEALKDEVGHWFEYCRAVEQIHAGYGVETTILAHSDVASSVMRASRAIPFFDETCWDGANVEPRLIKRYWGILAHNWRVFKRVDAFLRVQGFFGVAFAPTVTIHHLIAWRLLAAVHCNDRLGRIILLFRNNVGYYVDGDDNPRFRRASLLFRMLMKSFASLVASGRVVFATDSDRLADEYEALASMRPVVFPSPRVAPCVIEPDRDSADLRKRALQFSCLGPARFEKGVDVLQDAIRMLLRWKVAEGDEVEMRFVIQWNMEILDAAGEPYRVDPELLTDDRVEIISAPLDADAYADELRRTDCMVLPYRRSSYFARISGVAVEAVTAGIPVIFTKDTWCEEFVEKCGAGVGVADGDVVELAKAIEAMAADYHAYRSLAVSRAAAARSRNSAERLVRGLWGFDAVEQGARGGRL